MERRFRRAKNFRDLYYDLAKLHHALIVNGQIIRDNKFKVNTKNDRITLKIKKRANLIKFLNELENFVGKKLEHQKIKNNEFINLFEYCSFTSLSIF